jgi:hypothetical protein
MLLVYLIFKIAVYAALIVGVYYYLKGIITFLLASAVIYTLLQFI